MMVSSADNVSVSRRMYNTSIGGSTNGTISCNQQTHVNCILYAVLDAVGNITGIEADICALVTLQFIFKVENVKILYLVLELAAVDR